MDTTYPKVQGCSKSAQSLTIDIEALSSLFVGASDEGVTILELADATGLSPGKTRKLIREGCLAGVVHIGKRWVEKDWDGKGRTYIVYSMKES